MASKVTKVLEGQGYAFEADDKMYALRAPLSNERDDAARAESITKRLARMNDKDIIALAKLPAPLEEIEFYTELVKYEEKQLRAETDESEQEDLERRINMMYKKVNLRTAAESELNEIGRVKRDRYLARTLLIDEEGKPVDISKGSIELQDNARDAASDLWNDLNNLPFLSEAFSRLKSLRLSRTKEATSSTQ